MLRKPLVAGNWKMNMTVADARHLVSEMTWFLRWFQDCNLKPGLTK